MKISIMNANPDSERGSFDQYLSGLEKTLRQAGHTAAVITLRELNLHYCTGCWGCWVKTPGECVAADDGPRVLQEVIQSDFLLWAAPMKMGFPSALLKKMLDKSIPLVHPYFAVDHNEAHHRARYAHYPRLGLLLDPEPGAPESDITLAADIFARTALNMKSQLAFCLTPAAPVSELANQIIHGTSTPVTFADRLSPLPGERIQPPAQVTFFNGSPRGEKGNTPVMAGRFLEGFASLPGRAYQQFNLLHVSEVDTFRDAFAAAECALVGFPLYTDSMPGIVKAFFEALEPLQGRPHNPPMLFLVQSGFPEAVHSRHIERYLAALARRLGSPYLGAIVKGGCEGVRLMPDQMNARLFTNLRQLGSSFAQNGQLDPALLKRLAAPERFPAVLAPLFRVLTLMTVANGYWDQQLKKNGAFDKRFARPYVK